MSAGKLDLQIEQGADFLKQFKISNQGTAIDLTGYLFKGQVKRKFADVTPIVSFSFQILDQSATGKGIFLMSLPKDQANELPFVNCEELNWDLFYEDTGGTTKKLLYGLVTVDPRITR